MGKGHIRLVVGMADLHCGGTTGLLPPDFETFEGNRIGQTPGQKWMWDKWTHATREWLPKVVGKDPWALVINGDLIEGLHHRSVQVISADKKDHVECALQVLQPITGRGPSEPSVPPNPPAEVFIVEGTECHTGNDESTIGKQINARPDRHTAHKPRYMWGRLSLLINESRIVFQHHISVAIRTYLEASALSIHLGQEQLEAAKNHERIPIMLTCAHRHRFGSFRDHSGMCTVLPPWQALTRHGRKVVGLARTIPGLVAFDFRGVAPGELPHVRTTLYQPPEEPGVAL